MACAPTGDAVPLKPPSALSFRLPVQSGFSRRPVCLPIPRCPLLNILDFVLYRSLDFGHRVPHQLDFAGSGAGGSSLRSAWRAVPRCDPSSALWMDESAMASDGKVRAAWDLRPGVPLLPRNGRFRSVSESSPQRSGRRLN